MSAADRRLAALEATAFETIRAAASGRDCGSRSRAPRAAIEGALAKVRKLDGVVLATSALEPGGQISEDQRLASVDVRYSSDPAKIEKEDGEALIKAGESARGGGTVRPADVSQW